MSLLHENSAEMLVASRKQQRDPKEITDRPKFVSESAECRQIIRQRKRGRSPSRYCTTVFVGSLLRCVDFSADVNSVLGTQKKTKKLFALSHVTASLLQN